ncbi:putative UDP-glucose:glycoprotein glucosyltransferase [Aspergillus saccharolyticus JOP 1030-1]|uniref:Putative UDP-glucose:glyco protein glucosyltransferase n=1 Tax=Aspergillus saccharolyticus JOP 1030-1 TaxID=1450539 RepID=A0A318Z0W9_9EURO|nr:putative UDP-glucose:glyco protein glucosyltransferase [Aspergillus saccharolyticus JOP 1030-1]PYH40559.1 putative UDP-glucose:glyco protein glucosyltransferase [Aspergillus saccharolyticus JOP 1030-1]
MVSGSAIVASWRLTSVVVASALSCLAHATPSVNVALQASFDSAPYLIELLETAAEENSTSYFPLLDRVAEGAFDDAVTDKELYDRFLEVVNTDGHLRTPEALSSFKLSLAVRSASPRIAAHYQYYNASVQHSLAAAQDAVCPVWVHAEGKQYCSSTLERAQQGVMGTSDPSELPFDRVFGDPSLPPAILYADLASPMFKDFHQSLTALAREGQFSYRVRYRPPQHWSSRPLFVSGYGVELALKRTDYIVIDDRAAEERGSDTSGSQIPMNTEEDDLDDLRPLSSSEVSRLGPGTVGYVLDSQSPLDTLVKLSQDFPKYSPRIAAYNVTRDLLQEIQSSRLRMLPPGLNALWINGVQIDARQVDAFTLLDHLRRERKLIEKFRNLGLTASESVDLLSHKFLAAAMVQDGPQRYNYRDEIEGGSVIMWLNDLEKDARYESWPSDLGGYMQRVFPGQLPSVRREANNVVIPVNLANADDVNLIVKSIQVFVKNKIPVRFGLVPIPSSTKSIAQLKVAHYLQETFGLGSLMSYLETSASKSKLSTPDKAAFQAATANRNVRPDKQPLSLDEVLENDALNTIVSKTSGYLKRLGVTDDASHSFVNGVPIPRKENWAQELSARVSRDIQAIQQSIADGELAEDTWLPGLFLSDAFDRRNPVIVPEDPKDVRIIDMAHVGETHGELLDSVPRIPSTQDDVLASNHVIVVGDFSDEPGFELLTAALGSLKDHAEAEVLLLHNSGPNATIWTGSYTIHRYLKKEDSVDAAQLLEKITGTDAWLREDRKEVDDFWAAHEPLVKGLGLAPGANAIIVNGRVIALPVDIKLTSEDLDQLLAYEKQKRVAPVAKAAKALGFDAKLRDPLALAKLTSLAALSTVSDVPEGIYESTPDVRVNLFERWDESRSVVTVSNSDDPAITIVASIDPTSDVAQKWLPILKVLSELANVRMRLVLNPRDELQELPTKRFYRYVLDSEPSFNQDGSVARPTASFSGVPVEALLTLGMDVPSSWLVAPKDSVYDLDNIKLSSVKEGTDVDAIYALEHILIEGHSRDLTTKTPPRGVQLILGTEENPQISDTIIMANLGYFQFKAQPGLWEINLKPGRSEQIFRLDSLGNEGYSLHSNDDTSNEVALLSFQGKILYPRLSRKKGQEMEDVLETGVKSGSARDYVSKGLNFASDILSSVGINGSPKDAASGKQADINIFSVASGHLYERMLNIMMVSVMRNTEHSVKFWFIEQFLSPSFKSFLPHLAAEYGFSYEMVTYKWPHWLRAQTEKQREIWGYKILFLDVLFPLSLDKVIFVDADQIVRTDMYDLVSLDLEGAPYGFTPMCDSRHEMEGFRFWKQGYWKNFLRGQPYHISALYVVDLSRFRALAAGDRLRGQYQMLSADPGSLSNLDQDLPNHMQHYIPIKSLPQEWLWCETWCSDESLAQARTIDLCNNPLTKEPKLERARRQVPEWTAYDEEIAALGRRLKLQQEAEGVKEEPAAAAAAADDDEGWNKDEL